MIRGTSPFEQCFFFLRVRDFNFATRTANMIRGGFKLSNFEFAICSTTLHYNALPCKGRSRNWKIVGIFPRKTKSIERLNFVNMIKRGLFKVFHEEKIHFS